MICYAYLKLSVGWFISYAGYLSIVSKDPAPGDIISSNRADAVTISGPGASPVSGIRRYPIRITAEQVRQYPETGESVYNPWDALKKAKNLDGMPFYRSHSDRTILGRIVEPRPNDAARAIDGVLEVSEKMAPKGFLEQADSGKQLPISWDYAMKSRREDGEFEGDSYNTVGEEYIGVGVSYAPFPWNARCAPPKCGANVGEDITITKPVADAALISLMRGPNGAENVTEETKQESPQAEGAASGENPTVETKAATGVPGAASTEAKTKKVEAKTEEKKVETKAPEAKTDVQPETKAEGEGEKVTETKTEEVKAKKPSLTEEFMTKMGAFAEKVMPFMEDVNKRLGNLEGANKARADAEENAALKVRMDAFDRDLNEAGKALNKDGALFKAGEDAFKEGRTVYDAWTKKNAHLFDAKMDAGTPRGVQSAMFYPSGDDTRKLSFSGKSAAELAKEIFPGADPEKDFVRR